MVRKLKKYQERYMKDHVYDLNCRARIAASQVCQYSAILALNNIGALDGGSLCHLSILRKVDVPCYLIPNVTCRL